MVPKFEDILEWTVGERRKKKTFPWIATVRRYRRSKSATATNGAQALKSTINAGRKFNVQTLSER